MTEAYVIFLHSVLYLKQNSIEIMINEHNFIIKQFLIGARFLPLI